MRVVKYDTKLNEDRLPMLVKENSFNYQMNTFLNNPNSIYWFLDDKEDLSCLDHEVLWLMCFNIKNKLIGYFKVTEGSNTHSICSSREIFIKALAVGANKIALVHNHPSGDATPSKTDDITTENIKKGGEILGIELIDHLVLGDKKYYSYAEGGRI